jgi:hypothetical protein
MKVVIEKKILDDMYSSIFEKTEKLSDLIDGYIPYDELKGYMHGILNDIQFYVKEAYNPELLDLKLQLKYLQQKLESSKDKGVFVDDELHREYVQIKQKISKIENPF